MRVSRSHITGINVNMRKRVACHNMGFSLTEMLVTLLILALASTLMATGIPVAIDTYNKTVNSANAQIALSTTITVLRGELGSSTQVVANETDGKLLYYRCSEGVWAKIENPIDEGGKGLVKSFYSEDPSTKEFQPISNGDGPIAYPLVSDKAITDSLRVSMDSIKKDSGTNSIEIKELCVTELNSNKVLARVESLKILLPFVT